MSEKYNLLFMGTPEFAVPSFLKLLKSNYFNIVAVVTQPDKKSGRENNVSYSPIKKLSLKNNLNVLQPDNLNNISFEKKIKELKPDVILVVAYGKIIPKNILDIPKFGSINIHPSLLPKYRGPSPIQSSLLNNDKNTGTSIILMNEKMDEGDILYQKNINIKKNDNIEILHDTLSNISAQVIENVLMKWIKGEIKPKKQNPDKATYCSIISKSDGLINWNNNAEEIINKYRAYHPWPGVFNYIDTKKRKLLIKLTQIEISDATSHKKPGVLFQENENLLVATKDKKSIILKKVQIEGKKEISGNKFIIGYKHLLNKKLLQDESK